jgi:hypothetical protein
MKMIKLRQNMYDSAVFQIYGDWISSKFCKEMKWNLRGISADSSILRMSLLLIVHCSLQQDIVIVTKSITIEVNSPACFHETNPTRYQALVFNMDVDM